MKFFKKTIKNDFFVCARVYLTFISLVTIFVLLLTGCETTSNTTGSSTSTTTRPSTTTHTVTFNSDDGSSQSTQTVAHGAKIKKPADPTKTYPLPAGFYQGTLPSYSFTGWYNGDTSWDFDINTVSANITLTAHWGTPTLPISNNTVNTLNQAVAFINVNPGNFIYVLAGDEIVTSQTLNRAGNTLTLYSEASRTIKLLEAADSLLKIQSGKLVIDGNITMDADKKGKVVIVDGENSFLELKGGTFTGGDTDHMGGGVYIVRGATFTMSGGSITKNTASSGGGVFVNQRGIFSKTGGTISNNTATDEAIIANFNTDTAGSQVYVSVSLGSTYTKNGTRAPGGGTTFMIPDGDLYYNTTQ